MKKTTCSLLTVLCAVAGSHEAFSQVSATLPTRSAIIEKARLANDYWIENNDLGDNGWARATYYAGNQRFYEIVGTQSYLDNALAWAEMHDWLRAEKSRFNGDQIRNDKDADNHCCGQTYIELYRMDPQSVRIADIIRVEDYIISTGDVGEWSWIDAFFMQAPVLAKLADVTGEDKYTDLLWDMLNDTAYNRNLYDTSTGLWFRDGAYLYPDAQSPSGKKIFWSRGNGWVFAGLARVIDELPTDHPDRDGYIDFFVGMAEALAPLQQSDGFWRSNLADSNHFTMPETSGTAFFTYGMAWGINAGILSEETYLPIVSKGWNGLVSTALHPNGFLGYVQLVAKEPGASYYEDTKDYGVGALLLAASELSFLASDEVAGEGIHDNKSGQISYTGTWSEQNNAADYAGSMSWSANAGDHAALTFTGTGLSVAVRTGPSGGICNIYIDGALAAENIDTYSNPAVNQVVIYEATLTAGTHTVRLEATGEKNASARSANIMFDFFAVANVVNETIENDNSALNYTGNWGVQSGTADSGGSMSWSKIDGDKVSYTFTGDRVVVVVRTGKYGGVCDVQLDGSVVANNVDTYSSPAVSEISIYDSGVLDYDTHTIELISEGGGNTMFDYFYIEK